MSNTIENICKIVLKIENSRAPKPKLPKLITDRNRHLYFAHPELEATMLITVSHGMCVITEGHGPDSKFQLGIVYSITVFLRTDVALLPLC